MGRRSYEAYLLRLLVSVFGHYIPLVPVQSGSSRQSDSQSAPPISAPQADPKAQARILEDYGKLPLSFEANHGQTDARVKFLSRTGGYSLFLTGDEAVLTLRGKKASTDKAKIADAARTFPSSMAEPKPVASCG